MECKESASLLNLNLCILRLFVVQFWRETFQLSPPNSAYIINVIKSVVVFFLALGKVPWPSPLIIVDFG